MAITKITTPELFDFSSLDTALQLPTGPTSGTGGRPSNPSTGEWRYNTDEKYVEYYDGGSWRQIDTELTCTTNTVDYPTTNAAYYKLDSSAADQTTNNHDGTSTDITYYNGQQYSQGAVFNGSSSFISASNILDTSAAFSYSLWIKPNTISLYDWVIGIQQAASPYAGVGLFGNNSNTLGIALAGAAPQAMTPTLTLNTWSHIVLTHDGSGGYTCYTNNNGSPITYSGATSNNSANPFRLGFSGVSGWGYYDGSIDQVRLFTAELTASQVTELYNEVQCPCTTNTVDEPTTNFAYYKLDGNANDATNTYNGTWGSTEAYEYGPYGIAASFNATQYSYIDTNIGDTLWETDTWSVSMWLKHSDTGFTYFAGTTTGNSVINGMIFGLYGDGSRFDMIWRNNGGTASRYQGGSLPINTWTNIVVTSNSNEVFFYQDGSLMTDYTGYSQPITAADIDHSENFNIGRAGTASSYELMNGAIDQLRIFNTALSATQVRSLYDEVYCNTVSKLNIFNEGTSSCLALYEFEDDAKSTESSTYDGTWAGTEAYGGGQYKKAAIFNGSTSVVTSASLGTALDISSLSFSLWFNTNDVDATDSVLISSYNGSGDARFYASVVNSGLSVVIYPTSGSAWIQNFTSTVVIDNWYHLAVTHTGTTTTVYLNGTAITPSGTSGSAVAIKTGGSPQPLTIGLLQGLGSTYAFDGEIDQVRLFNKALTATEVLQVYTE